MIKQDGRRDEHVELLRHETQEEDDLEISTPSNNTSAETNSESSEVQDEEVNSDREILLQEENDSRRTNKLNFALANARSVSAKIPSLVDMFAELGLHFVLLTETWLKPGKSTKTELERLSDSAGIGMVHRHRCGKGGGGVAIAYDREKICLKKYPVVNGNGLEIVAAVGKAADFSRKCLVITVYIPPTQLVAQTNALWEAIADTVEQAKREHGELYIIVGGDTNNRPLANALADFPNMTVVNTGPTRGQAKLDEIATNFGGVVEANVFAPLEDENGMSSDHKSIICRALIPRVHEFTSKMIEYRKYTEESEKEFLKLIIAEDWDAVRVGSCLLYTSDAADE